MLENKDDIMKLPVGKQVGMLHGILEHVSRCPLGYIDGKLVMSRAGNEELVVNWLTKLNYLAEGTEYLTASPTGLVTLVTSNVDKCHYVYKVAVYEGDYILETFNQMPISEMDDLSDLEDWIDRSYVISYGKGVPLKLSSLLMARLQHHYESKEFGDGIEIVVLADAERVIHNVKWDGPYSVLKYIENFDSTGKYTREL